MQKPYFGFATLDFFTFEVLLAADQQLPPKTRGHRGGRKESMFSTADKGWTKDNRFECVSMTVKLLLGDLMRVEPGTTTVVGVNLHCERLGPLSLLTQEATQLATASFRDHVF